MNSAAINQGFFITGTDTDIGKTVFSVALVEKLKQRGYKIGVMKPIACGGMNTTDGCHNEDALALLAASNINLAYKEVNTYALTAPVSPNIAAQQDKITINLARITEQAKLIQQRCDYLIVEGVGGWQVPLTATKTTADMAQNLGLAVILVVGMRLGCLNHTLLTVAAIKNQGLTLAGWVANCLDQESLQLEENIATLRTRITAPLIATIPELQQPLASVVANHIDLDTLLCAR